MWLTCDMWLSVLFLLVTKIEKRMQNILYGETQQHKKKKAFWVFLSVLDTKTLKPMKRLYIEKQYNIFFSVLSFDTKNTHKKIYWVFVVRVSFQNAKQAKTPKTSPYM